MTVVQADSERLTTFLPIFIGLKHSLVQLKMCWSTFLVSHCLLLEPSGLRLLPFFSRLDLSR